MAVPEGLLKNPLLIVRYVPQSMLDSKDIKT